MHLIRVFCSVINMIDIPKTEIKRRWTAVQKAMDDFDALILPLGVNFQYFFGKPGMPSERIILGIIPKSKDPFILAPSFEISNFEAATQIDDIVGWEETESPYKIFEQELNDREIGTNIGVDPKLWIVEYERLSNTSKRHNFTSAGNLIDSIREVKSSWEIEQLSLASQYSSEGILTAFDRFYDGMMEIEAVPILAEELGNLSGNPLSFALVQFGENSALPHGSPSRKKLGSNDVVLLDVGTSVNGYQGDITITLHMGKPNQKFLEVYETVFEANRAAFSKELEGISGGSLDEVARKHIVDAGYGKYFTHRLGHGIGLEVHEKPYLVGTNSSPMKINQTHTIEPGIYLPGEFGVRIEDDVVLQEKGARRLYNTSRHNW